MPRETKVKAFVLAVAALACVIMTLAWGSRLPYPGHWEFLGFLLIAFLLEQSGTKLNVNAVGSLAFVMYLTAGVLFGGFWGGVLAGSAMFLSQLTRGNAAIKIVFNTCQQATSIAGAFIVYQLLGGKVPPAYLDFASASSDAIRSDLALFFVFAAGFFAFNSASVSQVVALTTGRPFREIWSLNTRGVLGYDLGASILAVLAALLFKFTEKHLDYGTIGLAVALVPIVVVRHVYGMYHQLQDSGKELLQVMVKAIEARDPYTSGHSLRVSELSHMIALELGLPTRETEAIRTAALLHDVGKIHEEFAPLLRKESRLSEEETALMQTHSTKSAELVGIISKFRGFVQDSVRHHHERWDGKGYPVGLAAKDIPLGSRIILISDTIDAMTTDRPYRKRLPLEVVIGELQKCKGTQFDPELVDVVISSVAVRRLIVGAGEQAEELSAPSRSRRVSWPSASIWKSKRA
jgi:putative nucleotidyltransferase with HDIG domain